MKLQNRLLTAFSTYLVLLLSVGLVGTVYSINSNKSLNDLSNRIFTSQKHVGNIKIEINLIHSEILTGLLINQNSSVRILTDERANRFYDELDALMKLHHQTPEKFQVLRNRFQEFYLFSKWLSNTGRKGDLENHPDALTNFLIQKNNLFNLFDNISNEFQREFMEDFNSINRHTMEFLTFAFILVLFGSLLAFVVAYFLSRSIARPVNKLTKTLSLVEKGNFKVYSDIERNDEIGQMARAVNSMSSELDIRFREMNYLQSLLQSILDSVKSMVFAVDKQLRVTHWNKNTALFTGIDAAHGEGRFFYNVFTEEILDRETVLQVIKTSEASIRNKTKIYFEERDRYFNISIYPQTDELHKGAVILILDVTDNVLMEDVMVQSEKMLSIGGLAAGMAHEINNPLAGIIQTVSVLRKRLMDGDKVPANRKMAEESGIDLQALEQYMKSRDIPRMFDSISASGRQITGIVENMLSFSRKENNRKSSHNIEELIDKTLQLAVTDYDLKKNYDFRKIKIEKVYRGNLPPLICESSKIQQVLLNLLRNGAQAMQEVQNKEHIFLIRTEFLEEKNMISIEVEDNGPGMDEETRKKVFDPFFTTKPEGIGTGLGLSVSYFIITDTHKGEMFVKSHRGKGTVFTIHLPLNRNQKSG
jgi:signal transduction histidine kinase/HAMP domain-containing protein